MKLVKREEAFSGVIRRDQHDEPKVLPCKCPHCEAIFLLHTDIITDEYRMGPCPNCDTEYSWNAHIISSIKYKFLRYWRMRNEA